ncbi:hypothetical protein P5G51_003735 [Virgibacillus sp. 179-BFC.A HS]|uniref:Uncharacterized protein n=1 Tax=Tigheibacillus jepli TaxID=3035914 RepID=A0ABU5CF55_9BACI|nr:hypothetical protein [Virgibacillus sp. 179-BFC.A HS]MDY0404636.1 hypothetical protein [Virgibacillus sp. 179-BFC.A HS]
MEGMIDFVLYKRKRESIANNPTNTGFCICNKPKIIACKMAADQIGKNLDKTTMMQTLWTNSSQIGVSRQEISKYSKNSCVEINAYLIPK